MTLVEVCHSEDALQAFLDYLVDPLLPAKSSSRDAPTKDEQQSVAKQVHSVVFLHNYYHIKQQPQVESLSFDAFCKMAVILKPPLLAHMKYMCKPGDTVLEDIEDQVSLTEKAVMDACDICKSLDPSKNAPNIKGWTVSKVAILLIDSQKEYCKLQCDCITNGVWSLIEKDLDTSNQRFEVTAGSSKKRRYIRKPFKEDESSKETGYQQIAYSAVKEVAGINYTDLAVLESHVVYSQSKEKTSTRFYIMQYNQVFNDNLVPIRDAINSLQGPLVSKGTRGWTTTPVVEYFHILPYSEVISEWLCRGEKCTMVDNPEKIEFQVNPSASGKRICVNASSNEDVMEDKGSSTCQSSFRDLEKLEKKFSSEAEILSDAALRVLMQKRNNLSLQQRIIEDEIALCDKNIQAILKENHCSPASIKKKRLLEVVLSLQNACQQLDGVCHENDWILPTYRVSSSDGGFQANVSVRGIDFEYSCDDDSSSSPQEARQSAAYKILAKLRTMATS